jgi:hypothetical protein
MGGFVGGFVSGTGAGGPWGAGGRRGIAGSGDAATGRVRSHADVGESCARGVEPDVAGLTGAAPVQVER